MIRTLAAITALTAIVSAQAQLPFDAPLVQADSDSRFVKTLDLNHDGWMDAVSAFYVGTVPPNAGYRIVGYYNDQTGKLARGWTFSVPLLTGTFTNSFDQHDAWDVRDLNGDGRQDFAFATSTTFYVYLSNGTLAPTAAVVQSIGPNWTACSIALADFDQDGDVDLALNRSNAIEICDIDLVNGVLVPRSTVSCPTWIKGRLVAGELTGDDTPDLFAFGRYVVPVQDGILGTPIAYSDVIGPQIQYEYRHDVGDIDSDGDLDAITFVKGTAPGIARGYRVLRRISPTQLVAEPLVPTGGPARDLVDVDGDGDLDAVCCGGSTGSGAIVNLDISRLRIALNDGLGNFADAIDVPNLGSSAIAGVVDMDHDGRVDFVAGRCVYYQRRPLVASPVPVIGAGNQTSRTVADFDGDGDTDFELLPWSVQRNRGDGGVTAEPIGVPPAPAGLAHTGQGHHGDWDGDGDEDSLMLTVGPAGIAGLDLLRNRGNGIFVSGGLVCGPAGLSGFNTYVEDGLAADVDQDGDQDLILRTVTPFSGMWKSAWWRNDGAAGFVYQTTISNFIPFKVVDFDGDGISDWIGSAGGVSSSDAVLSWVRGLGGALLAAPAAMAGGLHCAGVDWGDFDADGDLDIVAVPIELISGYRHPRLLWNQGNGSFATEDLPLALYTSSALQCVNALDVDGDGRLDFVVGPVRDTLNAAGVYLRKGDNSGFEAPIFQVLSGALNDSTFCRAVSADIDGDGDSDYVSYNRCFDNLKFDGVSAGSRLQHDTGFAGTGGIRPVLGAKGPFRVGEVAHVILRGARPGVRAYLVSITSSAVPLPTLPESIITRPPYDPRVLRLSTSGILGGEPGSGSCDVGFLVSPSLAGLTRHYTMLVDDPATHGHRSISNMLTISFAP